MISALLASAVITFALPEAPKLDVEKMLDAIAGAENWDGHSVGKAGEVGPWQMTPAVWRHCRGSLRKTMQQATPSELRTAARAELMFRIATAQINHRTVTPFLCGLLWGAGVSAALNGTASEAKRAYAERVRSIYQDSAKEKPTER